jgi:hypothetical protein
VLPQFVAVPTPAGGALFGFLFGEKLLEYHGEEELPQHISLDLAPGAVQLLSCPLQGYVAREVGRGRKILLRV